MKITTLRREDLAKAYRFDKKYVTGHTLASIKSNYARNPKLFVACYGKDKLIGLCRGSKRSSREVILRGIAVEAKYWKTGIGKKLLRAFEKEVRKLNAKKISVGAAKNVVGFYRKSGYKAVKQKKKYTVMEKDLA